MLPNARLYNTTLLAVSDGAENKFNRHHSFWGGGGCGWEGGGTTAAAVSSPGAGGRKGIVITDGPA